MKDLLKEKSYKTSKNSIHIIYKYIEVLDAILVKKSILLAALKTGLPSQLLHYKCACTNRMRELASVALDNVEKNNIIVAMTLVRCCMETASALNYIAIKILESLEKENLKIIEKVINKLSFGEKIESTGHSSSKFETSIHINCMLKFQTQGYIDDYNFLCKFIHPNSIGITGLYTQINFADNLVYFGYPDNNNFNMNENELSAWAKNLCIDAFEKALTCFIESEAYIHENLMLLIERCIKSKNND